MRTTLFKHIAAIVAVSLFLELCSPLVALALTSGPTQPEFSSFEPVATTNMVSEFTGDFTYNLPVVQIPGANGGGYALSLSYHAGTSPDEEASWVGYGWTLNPGAITRNTRGFPDDAYDATITYYNKARKNWTMTAGTMLGVEAFSGDFIKGGVSGQYSLRLNSYRGYGYTAGFNAHAMGLASFGYSVSDGKGTYSWSINPAGFLAGLAMKAAASGTGYKAGDELKAFADKMVQKLVGKAAASVDQMVNFYGLHSFQDSRRAINTMQYTGSSFNVTAGIQYTALPFLGLQGQLTANYSAQENVPSENLPTWGYMYSGYATASNAMMDYYVEKEVPYTMRDRFLAIPFSNADNFVLSGEGLGGGFRLYNAKPGHFRPNAKTSSISIKQVGAEGSIGVTNGVGADYGTGSQNLSVKEWISNNGQSLYKFASTATMSYGEGIDEPYFFRFNNDMGGSVTFEQTTYGHADQARSGINVAYEINPVANVGHRSKRSSYIAYHTNQEIAAGLGYTKDPAVSNFVNRGYSAIAKGIGEFAIYNEDGSRYLYGLPVYSMKEQTLQYGNKVKPTDPALSPDSEHYLATYAGTLPIKTPGAAAYVVGEDRPAPYANSFLLTDITTADYVDISNNGPSADDLGGYVRFAYARPHGSGTKSSIYTPSWYKWRIPYSGMLYQRNELSEPDDNTGSVLNGYKEIYFLDTIETKTHYAVFDKSERKDGISAERDEGKTLGRLDAMGTKKLQKLDKIRLYAKGADGLPSSDDKLLYTVHFDYTNQAFRETPNTDNGSNFRTGKLTLKKVWFEYEGVVNTKITPYVFGYSYRTSSFYNGILSPELMAKYTDAVYYGDGFAGKETPDYETCQLDSWGGFHANGKERYRRMQGWIDQNPAAFDPAAWQLKWIRLPSGGEIHVQYEQDDYNYVQDRRALAMVKTSSTGNTADGKKFYLDVATSLGASADPQKIANLIKSQFVDTQEEMYFKILYSLYDPGTTPTFSNAEIQGGTKRGAEYIKGYSRVKKTGVEGGKVYVEFENKPRQVGLDLVEAQKAGREERKNLQDLTSGSVFSAVIDFMSNFGRTFFDEATCCKNANWDESYIRIPIAQPKKGGGLRVKRLFMVDAGLDGSGSGNLYGTEYDYTMIDEATGERISSGVATNEPGGMREENALVTSLKKRFDQTAYQRATAGKDKDQFEGPIGESILPGASVGYARVVVKNMHDGLTGNGFTVHEFYTAKDYPFDKYYPYLYGKGVAWTDLNPNKTRSNVSLIISSKTYERIEAEQGYRFIINSMHGQVRRVSTYGGTFNDESTWVLSSMEEHNYYEPGETVPMFEGADKPFRYDTPGKEMEVVFEGREIADKTNNFTLEVDVSFLGLLFPIPTAFPSWTKNESILKTHVTSKVVRYPAIKKSMLAYKDGIYHLTENIAFSPSTGKPLLTRTSDGYDKLSLYSQPAHNGRYHSYSLTADAEYPGMGQKAANERAIIHSSTATHTISRGGLTLTFAGGTEFIEHTLTKRLYTGDLIKLEYAMGSPEMLYVGAINLGSKTIVLEDVYPNTSVGTGVVTSIEVVRSGRTNNLAAMVGSVSTYGEDKTQAYQYANELVKRQRVVNELNNALLRGVDARLYGWNTYGVAFRMSKIHPDSSSTLIRPLDPEYAIAVKLIDGGTKIEISPRRVVCGDAASPHPLVVQLNATLDQLWGATITTATTSTYCAALNTTDYTYASSDAYMKSMQKTLVDPQITLLRQQTGACMPWPWGGDFQNMTVSMLPSTPSGYYSRNTITGLSNAGGAKRLASLDIKYGNQNLLRCYVTTGTTCQYTWGFLPDEQGNLAATASYADFSGTGQSFATLMGPFTSTIGRFGQTNQALLFFDCFLTGKRHYYKLRFEKNVTDGSLPPTSPALVTTIDRSPTGPGYFALTDDGQIVYYKSGSSDPKTITCIDLPSLPPSIPARQNAGPDVTRVVSANAQTYDDNWTYDATAYGIPASVGNYQSGKRGKWRPKTSYVYKTSISDAVSGGTSDRVYNAGIYDSFTLFNKTSPAPEWLGLSTVTKYSPYGEALEERNILNVPSAAKFGYGNTVPVLVAQNAENTAVSFTSFEDQALGGGVSNSYAHAGQHSYALAAGNSYTSESLALNAQLKGQGLLVKFWVRTPTFEPVDGTFAVKVNRGGVMYDFPAPTQVARTGEWALYQAIYSAASLASIADGTIAIVIKAGTSPVYLDDVRVQPLDAQMMTYVYDAATLRVTAIMDDQHFGLYYQYNAEGKLVRKLKETERGIKTIAETHYHTPMVERTQAFASFVRPVTPSSLPSIFQDGVIKQNPVLDRLLNGGNDEGGNKFNYDKTLTVPDGQMDILQQQVDSVNNVLKKTKTSVQPKNGTGKQQQSPSGGK